MCEFAWCRANSLYPAQNSTSITEGEREKERNGDSGGGGGGCRNKRCPHYDGMFLK